MQIEKKGRTAFVTVGGDLRDNDSRDFVTAVKDLISEDFKRFTLDLSGVDFIDSYSLSNLIILCDKPELDFTFKNTGGPLTKIFDVVNFKNKVLFE
ncbi:MAG: STAS domain-containing protein [Candidatus Delongbacteria bacterium]|jgi:anti-anti-sigma factor|nr:STAS domain-containing protein [Candidatus Delongbacteria bacterium]MDY0017725.1 STAS domain-containing protein [Candidatus Delongbacteria bacterium]